MVLVPLRKAIDKFPLRPFLPSLVEQLSDADAGVREAARSACINLFSSATATAKSELKKEMERKAVRKQTADAILAQILSPTLDANRLVASEAKVTLSAIPRGTDELEYKSVARSTSRMGQVQISDDGISPVYIASQGDLERTFAAMMPCFEGKETEHNWLAREQSILKLRGMLRTGVSDQLYDGFLAGLKNVLEGIFKATASLRTTLSIHGLHLVSELARRMGEGFDSLAEPFIMYIIKMAGLTKKLAATASQVAVREILIHASYRHKFLDLIWQNVQEKTVTTRAFMCGHLITILEVHGIPPRKHLIEAHGGLDIVERILKKAVPDQNKDVREKAREALYLVEKIWPSLAVQVINSLDAATRKQVESNRGKVPESNSVDSNRASVVHTTKTPGTPVGKRPGVAGPSSAILAAKRAATAAAARVAQERRNKEEAEDSFQLQDEGEGDFFSPTAARHTALMHRTTRGEGSGIQDLSSHQVTGQQNKEQETSIQPPPPVSFPPITTPRSPLRKSSTGVSNGHRQGSLSPSLIPSPVSPQKTSKRLSLLDLGSPGTSKRSPSSSISSPSSNLATVDSRPRTISTSSTSSARSTGRNGSTATSNAMGRYDSFGQRIAQSSAGLDHTPASARVRTTSTTSNASRGMSPSLRDRGLPRLASSSSLHQTSSGSRNDETIHLDSLSLASKDLLASNNDFDTKEHFTSPAKSLRGENGVGSGASPKKTDDTSAPLSLFMDKLDLDEVGEMEQSKSTEQIAILAPVEAPDQEKIHSSSSSAVKWFLSKASRLDRANVDDVGNADQVDAQLSPVKKRPESEIYISQLLSGQADVKTFKGLARICREFKLPESVNEEGFDDGQADMLQPGKRSSIPISRYRREQEIAITMWQQGNLFESLFHALSTYLGIESTLISKDLKMAALIVLHRLVENQFKLFEVLGKEQDLIQLVYDLLKLNKNSNVKSACQAIMESWSEQTNVIIGISTLRGILIVYLGDNLINVSGTITNMDSSTSYLISIYTLSLRSLSQLFQKLPKELVEEEVEKCKSILKSGLNHWNIETRQQAVAVLVAANSKVQDPKSIFMILQPMERAQEDLLMYFMTKAEQA